MPRYANTSSYRRSQRARRSRFRKRTRGKYSLKKTVKRILNKNTETKYYDIAGENQQLYHNTGTNPTFPTSTTWGDPTFFNPWADIPPGTGRANRIGDKIIPLSMTLKLWLANKLDRPNVMFRVIITRMPKSIGTVYTTSSNVNIFQGSQLGSTGNTMVLPVDHDKGIKPYYDRTFNLQIGYTYAPTTAAGRECHKLVKLKIKRKSSNAVVYDSAGQNIINSPLAMYIIPYDSYGTLVTDNIASYAFHARLYYKDM